MKVSAVVVKPKRRSDERVTFSSLLILPVFSILGGLVSGTLLYCLMKESLYNGVFQLFISFFTDFSQKSSPEIISGLILSELPFIVVMLILSFSVIGFPFVLFSAFTKTLAPTLLFSHLYSEYGLTGAEYVFLVLFLGEAVNLFGTLLMTQSSFLMSNNLYKSVVKGKGECTGEIKSFCLRFAVSAAVIVLSNIITYLSVTCFSGLFSF